MCNKKCLVWSLLLLENTRLVCDTDDSAHEVAGSVLAERDAMRSKVTWPRNLHWLSWVLGFFLAAHGRITVRRVLLPGFRQ